MLSPLCRHNFENNGGAKSQALYIYKKYCTAYCLFRLTLVINVLKLVYLCLFLYLFNLFFILIIFDHRSMIMKFSKHTELVQHFETWNMMWITLPYNFLIRRQLGCPSALLANWQQFEIPSWNLEVSHPPLPNYEQNKASRRMDQFAWFLSAIEKICVLENSFSFPSPAFVAFLKRFFAVKAYSVQIRQSSPGS